MKNEMKTKRSKSRDCNNKLKWKKAHPRSPTNPTEARPRFRRKREACKTCRPQRWRNTNEEKTKKTKKPKHEVRGMRRLARKLEFAGLQGLQFLPQDHGQRQLSNRQSLSQQNTVAKKWQKQRQLSQMELWAILNVHSIILQHIACILYIYIYLHICILINLKQLLKASHVKGIMVFLLFDCEVLPGSCGRHEPSVLFCKQATFQVCKVAFLAVCFAFCSILAWMSFLIFLKYLLKLNIFIWFCIVGNQFLLLPYRILASREVMISIVSICLLQKTSSFIMFFLMFFSACSTLFTLFSLFWWHSRFTPGSLGPRRCRQHRLPSSAFAPNAPGTAVAASALAPPALVEISANAFFLQIFWNMAEKICFIAWLAFFLVFSSVFQIFSKKNAKAEAMPPQRSEWGRLEMHSSAHHIRRWNECP